MYYKPYILVILSKIVELTIAAFVGFFAYTLIGAEGIIFQSINIFQFIYLLYAINILISLFFFNGKTLGVTLFKIDFLCTQNRKIKNVLRWRELILLLILNLTLYEYGYLVLLIFIPVRTKNKSLVMVFDTIFDISYSLHN